MKKIVLCIAMAIVALFTGCNWLENNLSNVNAETYAKTAGKAIATIVVSTDKYFTPESKSEFAATLAEVIAKMPKDISSTNLQDLVTKVVDEKLATTVPDSTKRQAYSAALKIVYQVIGSALEVVETKYSKEFKDAETAYSLVLSFFASINDVMNAKLAASDDSDLYKAVYADMLKVAEKQK